MIKIFDNFLDKETFTQIKNFIMGDDMPWFFNNKVNEENNRDYYFTHTFFRQGKVFSSLNEKLIIPLINQIKYKKLIAAKANLFTKKPKHIKYGLHTDYPKDFSHTTIILSINTNNGYTEFENGQKVESVENRLLIFDGQLLHQSVGQTDTKQRINLNINIER